MVEPYTELEERWAEFCGVDHVAVCSSGTAAIHLALVALGVGKGDEVIVPEFTMVACANAVTYTGATPVFVDCREDFQIDTSLIRGKITNKTKALLVAHIYNGMCNMRDVMEISREYGIPVIEDAAEAQGAEQDGKKAGTIGTIGCFSFYKNKIIAAEEGGAVVSNMGTLVDEAKRLRSHHFDEKHTYLHQAVGFNYRMPNSQAQMVLDQDWNALIEKRKNADGTVNWVYPQLFETEAQRDLFYYDYKRQGANPRLFFKPMSMQPMYRGEYGHLVAYDLSRRGLYLPHKHG